MALRTGFAANADIKQDVAGNQVFSALSGRDRQWEGRCGWTSCPRACQSEPILADSNILFEAYGVVGHEVAVEQRCREKFETTRRTGLGVRVD